MLAAVPTWFADNIPQISAATLVLLVVVVIRFVQKAVMRAALLLLIAIAGSLVYTQRAPLRTCAKTCECQIAGRDITVPTCSSKVKL